MQKITVLSLILSFCTQSEYLAVFNPIPTSGVKVNPTKTKAFETQKIEKF